MEFGMLETRVHERNDSMTQSNPSTHAYLSNVVRVMPWSNGSFNEVSGGSMHLVTAVGGAFLAVGTFFFIYYKERI